MHKSKRSAQANMSKSSMATMHASTPKPTHTVQNGPPSQLSPDIGQAASSISTDHSSVENGTSINVLGQSCNMFQTPNKSDQIVPVSGNWDMNNNSQLNTLDSVNSTVHVLKPKRLFGGVGDVYDHVYDEGEDDENEEGNDEDENDEDEDYDENTDDNMEDDVGETEPEAEDKTSTITSPRSAENSTNGSAQKGHNCVHCPKVLPSRSALLRHLAKHDPNYHFPCKECGETFRDLRNLHRHRSRHSTDPTYHTCSQCGKTFPTFPGMMRHYYTHFSEKPFECDMCSYTSRTVRNLTIHKRTCGILKIRCYSCGRPFASESSLAKHNKRPCTEPSSSVLDSHVSNLNHTAMATPSIHQASTSKPTHTVQNGPQLSPNIGLAASSSIDQSSVVNAAPIVQAIFNWYMNNNSQLNTMSSFLDSVKSPTHLLEPKILLDAIGDNNQDQDNDQDEDEQDGVGEIGSEDEEETSSSSRSPQDLENGSNGSGQNGPYCPHCPKVFRSGYDLKRHQAVHDPSLPYTCHLCNELFKYKRSLQRHTRNLHSNDRPHACEVCKRTFVSNVYLKKHQLHVHSEKPYQCEACSMSYSNIKNLARHKRTSCILKIECDGCGKAFSSEASRAMHKRRCTQVQCNHFGCSESMVMTELGVHLWQKHIQHDSAIKLTGGEPKEHKWRSMPYRCHIELCEFRCPESWQFHPHYSSNHRVPYCPLCLDTFPQAFSECISRVELIKDIEVHLRMHILAEYQYKGRKSSLVCTRCQLHFWMASKLKEHLEQDHADDDRPAEPKDYFYAVPQRCTHVTRDGEQCTYTTRIRVLFEIHTDRHGHDELKSLNSNIRIARSFRHGDPIPIQEPDDDDPNSLSLCTTCGTRAQTDDQFVGHWDDEDNADHIGFTSA